MDIEEIISAFLRRELLRAEDRIDPDENLFTSGLVDSVGMMRLIAHLEQTLQLKVPPTELVPENFRTVRVMAAYLQGKAGDPERPAPDLHGS